MFFAVASEVLDVFSRRSWLYFLVCALKYLKYLCLTKGSLYIMTSEQDKPEISKHKPRITESTKKRHHHKRAEDNAELRKQIEKKKQKETEISDEEEEK